MKTFKTKFINTKKKKIIIIRHDDLPEDRTVELSHKGAKVIFDSQLTINEPEMTIITLAFPFSELDVVITYLPF